MGSWLYLKLSNSFFFFNLKSKIDETNKGIDKLNRETKEWNEQINKLYSLDKESNYKSMRTIDSLVSIFSKSSKKLTDLYYVKANLQYLNNNYEDALNSVNTSIKINKYENPKQLSLKGACLAMKGKFKDAEKYFITASSMNYDFKWELGNFYELQKNKLYAKTTYQNLLKEDSIIYRKCKLRIIELDKSTPNYLNKIKIKTEENRYSYQRTKLEIY